MNKYATTPQGQYHGPLPVRNFFPLPNIIFDLGLTAEEIAVYAFLMKCEDRRTYLPKLQNHRGRHRQKPEHGHQICEYARRKRADHQAQVLRDHQRRQSVERQSDFQDSASQKRAGCLLLSADVETKEYPVFQAGKAP